MNDSNEQPQIIASASEIAGGFLATAMREKAELLDEQEIVEFLRNPRNYHQGSPSPLLLDLFTLSHPGADQEIIARSQELQSRAYQRERRQRRAELFYKASESMLKYFGIFRPNR